MLVAALPLVPAAALVPAEVVAAVLVAVPGVVAVVVAVDAPVEEAVVAWAAACVSAASSAETRVFGELLPLEPLAEPALGAPRSPPPPWWPPRRSTGRT